MAKKSAINNNEKKKRMVNKYAAKRAKLKALIANKDTAMEERFDAVLKLAKLPRNSSKIRIRNRCELTGRPRGTYRKFKMSRSILRDLANRGQIPGVVKASW